MKKIWIEGLLISVLMLSVSCKGEPMDKTRADKPEVPEGAEVITLGGGCFWCLDAVFKQIEGVISVTSGYMGGNTVDPTYEAVVSGTTGHAEVVQVVYDPKKLSTTDLLAWFWNAHDPTQLNRQGNDVGTQYRSAIFFHNENQKKVAEKSKEAAQAEWDKPIVTEITKAPEFYPAEKYHQDYYFNGNLQGKNSGYCRAVIKPKLKKLKLDH